MSQGDVEARVVADTSGLQAGMVQAAVVTEAQMKKIAQYVKSANDSAANLGKTAQSAAASTSSAYRQISEGADTVRTAHAGMTRELVVLGHELSQGNLKKFGGSLLVLAEYSPRAQAAISALLGPIGALVGVAALVGVGMIEGALDAERFAKSLQLTGNYAALTQNSLEELAKTQRSQTGQSLGGSRETIEAAAGSGAFGPSTIAAASRAMGDYEKITGEAAEAVVGKFKTIQDGVAKWAEEQNKQLHFLTLGEYDHIKALEESGDKEQAAIETLNLLSSTMESRATPATGALAATWKFLKESVQDAGKALSDVGKPTTLDDHINSVKRQIAELQSPNFNAGIGAQEMQERMVPLQRELNQLTQEQFKALDRVTTSAYAASKAEEGIAGQKAAEEWIKRGKAVSAYDEALKKFRADAQAAADAGKPFKPEDIAAGEGAIKKQFTDHSAAAQSDEYKNLQATIKAFNSTTDEEISRVGKLTDGQKFSIQAHEELAKAGKKLSDQQRATISAAIDEAAAHRTVADAILAAQKANIAAVQAETANHEQQQKMLEDVIAGGNDQANSILRQSQLIGKSADEITKIQVLQKFDDLVGKALLGADNDTVNRINEVAGAIRGNLVDSLDAAKKAQDDYNASFQNGWSKASQDFTKKAANSAAYGEQVFNDFSTGATDDLARLAETGKLSFDGLTKTIIDDLIKMEIQKGLSWAFGSSGSGSAGMFGALSSFSDTKQGSAGPSGTGSLFDLFSSNFGGSAYANGLDYVPYDGFPAILHEGEKVSRRQDAAVERNSGKSNITISSTNSYGAGVDVSTVAQMQRASEARVKADVGRALSTNGRFSA